MEHATTEDSNPAGFRVAGVLIVLAGAFAVAGFVSGWARLVYPSPGPTLITDAVGHGRAELLLGLFLLASGIVALAFRSPEVRRAWLSVGIVCGLTLGGVAVFDLVTERARAIDELIRASATSGVRPGTAAGLIVFSFRPGVFAALLSGGLAVAAAVVLLVGARRPGKEAAAPLERASPGGPAMSGETSLEESPNGPRRGEGT